MKVYVFDSDRIWRPIREEEAEIKVCEKTVWAVLPNGRRHLMGATAFTTIASARRSHLGLLRQQERYLSHRPPTYTLQAIQSTLRTYH